MKRRTFIRNTALGTASLMVLPSGLSAYSFGQNADLYNDELLGLFKTPPDSSKPWVFWQWMNGNITKEGITLDLEAMNRMGIGGVLCFNNAVGIPRGPIDYASDQWLDMVKYAADECARLGMTLMLHNGAGYSGSGGPWVTPEMSMQQLVWSETQVRNVQKVKTVLPQPQQKEHYYKDAYVLAYPSLSVENGLMHQSLTEMSLDGQRIDKSILLDQNSDTKIRMDQKGEVSSLLLIFNATFEARSITVTRKPEEPKDRFDGPRDHPPRFTLEASVDGLSFTKVAQFDNPQLREMDTPSMQNFDAVSARYYRLSTTQPTWLSSVELHGAPRLAGWPGKANWTHGNSHAFQPELDASLLIDPATVVDISGYMDESGRLNWKAPKKGNWTIVRIGHTTTGEEPAAHPDAGKGLEIDKFRKEAVDFHYDQFLSKVIAKLNEQVANSFQGFTTDSWEAGKQNWSVVLPAEFEKRRGYAIGAWLLTMTGRIVASVEDSNRFLWDMNKTQAELLSKNYYGRCQELCHQHGLQYHAEPYGDGNLDSLEAGQYLDVPMSEFWTRYIYGSDMTSKQSTSIAHVYGKKVAAAESFTGMPLTSKWMDYPYSLKAEGDYFFALGVNRLVFHVFVHQPYTSGMPAMTMGPFGTHFDRNNTWTEQAHGWISYLRRAQYLLQQGLTVADVAWFKGEDAGSGVPDVYRILPDGYVADVVGRDALFSRFSISNQQIVLPDGMNYKVCALHPVDALMPETVLRLIELVKAGMTLLVQKRPTKALGLSSSDEELQVAVNDLFGDLTASVRSRQLGDGKVIWVEDFQQTFNELGITPDFTYTAANQDATIHYTHKKLAEGEFYFISNHKRRKESITCSLRISGYTPELWDAETGQRIVALVSAEDNGRTLISMELAPVGSVFIFLREKEKTETLNAITKDGQVVLSTAGYAVPNSKKYIQVHSDFSITFWAKPDSYAHDGRSMVFHAEAGERLFGQGHAICGLGLGRNGLKVYEQANRREAVLEYNEPIPGWSHFTLVYQQNIPTLFVNGVKVAEGEKSKYQVHPGLESLPAVSQFNSSFEGNITEIKLHRKGLSATEVRQLSTDRLPDPELLPAVIVREHSLLFTQNGKYVMEGETHRSVSIQSCGYLDMSSGWEVAFPKGLGVPERIAMDQLKSLHLHPDFGVKHFSGTANYNRTFQLGKDSFTEGRRFLLDLGRVEVVAELWINGTKIDLLWKAPFASDITEYVKIGKNEILVAVTNLWPNRLIGDENLPVENEYSEHGFIKELPDWYVSNQPKPRQRVTFSVWHNYEKSDTLFESGLLGPVSLILGEERKR